MPAVNFNSVLLRLIRDVTEIRANLRRTTVNLPLFDVANENTPVQLTTDQDNYVIGNYDLLRMNSSQAVIITGLRGGIKGRFLRIFNVGSYGITLSHQDTSSLAANRFYFSNGQDVVVPPSSNVTIYYDSTIERWIGGDSISAGAVWAATVNNVAQASGGGPASVKMDPGTVVLDQYGFYDDANNRYLLPFSGFYRVGYWVTWAIAAFTGTRQIYIYHNGSEVAGNVASGGNFGIRHESSYESYFSAGDRVEFYSEFSGGASLNVNNIRTSISKIT